LIECSYILLIKKKVRKAYSLEIIDVNALSPRAEEQTHFPDRSLPDHTKCHLRSIILHVDEKLFVASTAVIRAR
jgi:chorismate-pyruvate lyase